MSGSKCAYLSQKQLQQTLGGATYTPPTTFYALASTAAFDPDAVMGSMSEPSGGAYARVAITNDNSVGFSVATSASPSVASNLADIVFPTATTDWGTPLSMYLADASSGGNLYYGADLLTTADVAIGDVLKVLAGTFIFSED